MTREEKLAYGRGYNAGSRSYWPDHRPPLPPDELVAALMAAARRLRDEADGWCATLEPDDAGLDGVKAGIDGLDEAMAAVGRWLKGCP